MNKHYYINEVTLVFTWPVLKPTDNAVSHCLFSYFSVDTFQHDLQKLLQGTYLICPFSPLWCGNTHYWNVPRVEVNYTSSQHWSSSVQMYILEKQSKLTSEKFPGHIHKFQIIPLHYPQCPEKTSWAFSFILVFNCDTMSIFPVSMYRLCVPLSGRRANFFQYLFREVAATSSVKLKVSQCFQYGHFPVASSWPSCIQINTFKTASLYSRPVRSLLARENKAFSNVP